MGKTKCIAFANNKGGSGKTTSCANVGYCLWTMGKKVLLIDGDMQMNLSLSYFDEDRVLEFATAGHNLYSAILKQDDLIDYIIPTEYVGLDLIPSSTLMSGMEFKIYSMENRELLLKNSMKNIIKKGGYDYILHGILKK